jgi:hypothetical protein
MFIGGYGRSGSTLLCAVLGGAEHAVPLGELNRIFLQYLSGRKCSCGHELRDCDFWNIAITEFERRVPDISVERAAEITSLIESYSNWLLIRYRGTTLETQYARIWTNMLEIIGDISGQKMLIDASKSSSIACNRVAAISKIVDTKQILLVRDPRAVMSSTLETQKRRLTRHGIKPVRARGLRTLLSWMATNFYAHFVSAIGLKKIDALISYEYLTSNPAAAINDLGDALDVDLKQIVDTIQNGKNFSADHIFSGDGQRMNGEYQIKQIPPKWPKKLTKFQVCLSSISYPIARWYGYFRVSNTEK